MGQIEQAIFLLDRVVITLERRGRGPKQNETVLHLRAHNRDIARVITRRFLLLVGSFVLFIDHDQAEIIQRSKHRAACSDYDPGAAGLNLVPFVVALAFGQVAVQNRDRIVRFGETALKPLHGLGRERNFRDENDCRLSAHEGRTDCLQINFCFPAPGHAVEQNRFCFFWCSQRFLNRAQGGRLLQVQGEVRRGHELLICVWIARYRLFAQDHESALLQCAQRLVIERCLAEKFGGRNRVGKTRNRLEQFRLARSSPSQFLPQHARDAALFSTLAIATGGTLAMPMGAALMNYMGHYVGALAAASPNPKPLLLLGWHPWSIVRIVSFVAIGVVLSAPLWSRVGKFQVNRREARAILLAAGTGLIVDVVIA